MAMAEPADFVHLYDTKQDYTKSQEIDLFGEIAGISFSPDTEAFFVGVADRTYGSLLEFNRRRMNYYLDSILWVLEVNGSGVFLKWHGVIPVEPIIVY